MSKTELSSLLTVVTRLSISIASTECSSDGPFGDRFRPTPRGFAKQVRDYGPEAAAQASGVQTFIMYGWLIFLAGFVLKVSGAGLAGVVAYVLTGVCIIWIILHIPFILRSQRRYRRSPAS